MVHDLDIEVVLPEDLLHFPHIGMGALILPVQQHLRQVAAQAGAQADQALVVFPDQVVIDARFIVVPGQESFADQVHQILVSCVVFAQQDQVAVLPSGGRPVRPVPAHIGLTADNRFDSRVCHRRVKFDRAVKHTMIRHGT